jgi:Bacterial Ig-like domain
MKSPRFTVVPLLALILMACAGGTDPTPLGSTPDFEASLTPATASVTQGQQAGVTVMLKRLNGFAGAVSLSLPNPATGIGAIALSIPSGSDSDQLTITTDASATIGNHSLELSAVSGSLTHPISLELTVNDPSTPDFSLTITPSSVAIKQGLSTALDVTLNRLNGFAGDVTVTLGNPPAGLSAASLVIPAGSSTGKLNLAASANAVTGSGSTTVKGVSGALSHSANLSWTILSAVNPDFALSVISGFSVIQGTTDGVKFNINRQNGFAGSVAMTLVNPPSGITAVPLSVPSGLSSDFFQVAVGAQVPVGTINLTLSGTGGGLTRTTKLVMTIVAAPDTTAPTLVSSSPADNATGVAKNASVVLNFSEPMNPNNSDAGTAPNAPGFGVVTWSNNNTTLTVGFIPTVVGQPPNGYSSNTKYVIGFDGEDVAGNSLVHKFSFTTATFADTTAPTVLDTVPAIGAQGVSPGLGKTFTATFSEKMGSSVLNAINFVPNAGATNCVFTDPGNTTVQCTPTDGLLPNQFYIMTITTAAKDVAGNPLAQLNAISFNTGPTPDTIKPKISSATPQDSTTGIDPNPTIAVYFSEPMDKAATQAAFTFLTPSLTASESVKFSWNPTGITMFVQRSTPFLYGVAVIWNVGPGAKDLSGNVLEGASSALRGFTVIHKGTFKLYSDGSLDGFAMKNSFVFSPEVQTSFYLNPPSTNFVRGFITFDLSKLPNLTKISNVTSASMHVFQDEIQCNGDQYGLLGNVLVENISYAVLSSVFFNTFFNTAPIATGTTNILSTNATLGYKVMDATKQVGYDVQNHNGLFNRSQWRLKFANDATSQGQNCGDIRWADGTATQSKKPYLDITYLYP